MVNVYLILEGQEPLREKQNKTEKSDELCSILKYQNVWLQKEKKMREIVKYKLNQRKVEGNSNIIAQNLCH